MASHGSFEEIKEDIKESSSFLGRYWYIILGVIMFITFSAGKGQ